MKNIAIILATLGAIALQGCSNGGKSPKPPTTPGPVSSSVAITSSSKSSISTSSAVNTTSSVSTSSAISSTGSTSSVPTASEKIKAGKALMSGVQCRACHQDNNDGTFGVKGQIYFDVNDFNYPKQKIYLADTAADLATYIAATMPLGTPGSCKRDDCADPIAAYLWSLRKPVGGSSSVSSSSVSSSSSPATSSAVSSSAATISSIASVSSSSSQVVISSVSSAVSSLSSVSTSSAVSSVSSVSSASSASSVSSISTSSSVSSSAVSSASSDSSVSSISTSSSVSSSAVSSASSDSSVSSISTSSSVSSSAVSSVSSASSSSAGSPWIPEARRFIKELNTTIASLDPGSKDPIGALGSVLTDTEKAAYNQFSTELASSKLFGFNQAESSILGKDVSVVMSGFTTALTEMGVRYVNSFLGGVLPENKDISMTLDTINDEEADKNYTQVTLSAQTIQIPDCKGEASQCSVKAEISAQINGTLTGSNAVQSKLNFVGMDIDITKFVVWNNDISVELVAAQDILKVDSLKVTIDMKDGAILSARPIVKNFSTQTAILVKDKVAKTSLKIPFNVAIKDLTMTANLTNPKSTTYLLEKLVETVFGFGFEAANNAGDKLALSLSAKPSLNGTGAVTLVDAEEGISVDETDSKFLGLALTTGYTALIGGKKLIEGSVIAGRPSLNTIKVDDFSVKRLSGATAMNFGLDTSLTTLLTLLTADDLSQVANLPDVMNFDAIDAKTGIAIKVATEGGETKGTIKDPNGEVIANIIKYVDEQPGVVLGDKRFKRELHVIFIGESQNQSSASSASSASSVNSSLSSAVSSSSSWVSSSVSSVVSSSQSSVSSVSSSASSVANTAESIARGKTLIQSNLCAGCHTDNGDGTFGNIPIHVNDFHHGDTKAEWAQYIDESMPPGSDSSKCTGACATDIANYLWSLKGQNSATLVEAKAAIKDVKDLVTALNAEPDLFKKPGALLSEKNQAAYASFAEGLKASDVLVVNSSNQLAMGSDLTYVINALTKVLTATGIEFVGTIASGILKNETGIVIQTAQIQPEDEEAYPYWNFKLNDTVNPCAKDVPPCNVKVDLELDLIGDATGTSQVNTSTLRIAEGYRINVKKLTASRGDISVGVKPGDALTFAKNFDVKINSKNGVMETFNINSRNLNLNVPAWIKNSKTGYAVNAVVNASSIFKLDLNLAKEASADVAAEPMTIALTALSDTTKLAVLADITNTTGDTLKVDLASGVKFNGEAPMVIKLGDIIDRGETETKFIGLDVTGDVAFNLGGQTVMASDIKAVRNSLQKIVLTDAAVDLDGKLFNAQGAVNLSATNVITLSQIILADAKAGAKLVIDSSATGVVSGQVQNATGQKLGDISEYSEVVNGKTYKRVKVTYLDGSSERLY